VGVDVGALLVECQRTAVEGHHRSAAAAQAQFEAASEGARVHESVGWQRRYQRKHATLEREQSVRPLDRPRPPRSSGDVVPVDQALLQQVARHHRRLQADSLQPVDGSGRTGRYFVELLRECA
jgi:hypothetical protein